MPPPRIVSAICICALTAACSGLTPVEPSRVAADAGELKTVPSGLRSTVQRVEEGGGSGGNGCGFFPGVICAIVTLRTQSNLMEGIGVAPLNGSPFNFSIRGQLDQLPDPNRVVPIGIVVGQFSTGSFDITVKNGVATVALTLVGPFDKDNASSASGSAPAVQSRDACGPLSYEFFGGFFTYTDLTLQLPHLGRTDINIWGWVGCTL